MGFRQYWSKLNHIAEKNRFFIHSIEWIYTQKFNLKTKGSWNLARFHNKFFGSFNIPYEDLDSMSIDELIKFKGKIT